jgi:hypothetical protein
VAVLAVGRDVVAGRALPAVRAGWAALLAVSCVVGFLWARTQVAVNDEWLFRRAGGALLGGRWSEVYADPIIQAGPFELAWVRLLGFYDAASPGLSMTVAGVVGVPLATLAAGYAVRLVRGVAGLERHPGAELGIACLAFVWGVSEAAVFSGHPSEAFVPLHWLAAAVLARRGRGFAAGVTVGLGAGWEVWSVLGSAVLLLGPHDVRGVVRQVVRGVAGLGVSLAALFLPFVLTGEFRMFENRWIVVPESLVAVPWPDAVNSLFPWPARLAQAACAGLASLAVAWVMRRDWHAVWLVPLVATAVRLVLDPVLYAYYWTPVLLLALAGLATVRLRSRPGLVVCALCAWQPWPAAHTWWGTLAVTLPLALTTAVLAIRAPRPRPTAPTGLG